MSGHSNASVRYPPAVSLLIGTCEIMIVGMGCAVGTKTNENLEARLRATLDSLLDPHVVLRAIRDDTGEIVDFEYIDANAAACAYNQRSRDELIGVRLLDLMPSHMSTGLLDMYKRVIETGEPLVLDEFRYAPEFLPPELAQRCFDIRAVPVDDGLVYTWRDVTERVDTVQALRAAEHRYRALADAASDLVFGTDERGIVQWMSPSVTRVLGYTPEDFVGHSMVEFADADDVQLLFAKRAEVYDGAPEGTDTDPSVVVHLRDQVGVVRPMSVFVSRDVDQTTGSGAGLVVGMRDVGDLLRSREEAARASQQAEDDRLALDRAMIGMATMSWDGVVTHANASLENLLGVVSGGLDGRVLQDWLHPGDVGLRLQRPVSAGPIQESVGRQRRRFLAETGATLWADVWVSRLESGDGPAQRWLVQVVDVTAEVQAQDALQRSVRRFRLLAENASDVVYQTDINGVIDWISPSVSEVLGWDPDLLIGTRSTALVAPEDLAMMGGSGVIRGVREHGVIAQFLTVRGGRKWMSVNARPILDRQDDVTGAVVSLRDVTTEQEAHQELALTQQRFRLAMDAAPQGMALTDGAGTLVDLNPAAGVVLGVRAVDVIGQPFAEVITGQIGPCNSVDRHEHIRLTDAGQIWVDHVTNSLCGDDGAVVYVVHQFIDETSDRMWQQELEHWASHDVLTGVANRRSLINHLERLLQAPRGASPGDSIAVLFCDMDNLKTLNDTFGHQVGDAVLATIADRIARSLRRGDRVGRIGGDEFVVVLDGVESDEELARVADKIRLAVHEPIHVMDNVVATTMSIGATFATKDAAAALARADSALYRAKEEGRDRVAIAD